MLLLKQNERSPDLVLSTRSNVYTLMLINCVLTQQIMLNCRQTSHYALQEWIHYGVPANNFCLHPALQNFLLDVAQFIITQMTSTLLQSFIEISVTYCRTFVWIPNCCCLSAAFLNTHVLFHWVSVESLWIRVSSDDAHLLG